MPRLIVAAAIVLNLMFAPTSLLFVHAAQESLSDLIPLTDKIAVFKDFATEHVHKDQNQIAVTGTIHHTIKLTVTSYFKQKDAFRVDVVNTDLRLSDLIPQVRHIDLSFRALEYADQAVTIETLLNGRNVTVTWDLLADSLTLGVPNLKLKEVMAAAPDISVLDEITFDHLTYAMKDHRLQFFGTLNRKNVMVQVDDESKTAGIQLALSGDRLTLADIFAQVREFPGIGILGFDKLHLTKNFIEAQVDISGYDVYLVENVQKEFTAFYFDRLSAADFIPVENNPILDQMALGGVLFMILPSENGSQTGKVIQLADLPLDLQTKVDFGSSREMTCMPGINVAAQAKNVFKEKLEKIGITKETLPLIGRLPLKVFSFLKHADKKQAIPHPPEDKLAFLKGVSLSLEIPIPKIPAADRFVVFHDAMISLSGDMGQKSVWNRLPAAMADMKPKGDLDISLQGGLTLTLDKFSQSMDALIDLNENGDTKSFSLVALSNGQWKEPFGVKGVVFKDGGFDISLSKGAEQTEIELAFFGTADVHDKNNLAIRADFDKKTGAAPVFKYIAFDGPIKLSDLDHRIPDGEKFEIDTVKMDLTGIEAKIKLFDTRLDAYFFEYRNGVHFAVDLAKFKLGALVPSHNSLPQKVMDTLNGITLPRAALMVSSKSILDTVDHLPEIGRDLFKDIYKNQSSVKIDSGISFIGIFSASVKEGHLPAQIRTLLIDGIQGVKVGFSETATLSGTIKGVFDANDAFGLDLDLMMDTQVNISLPKAFQRAKTAVSPGFFIRVMPDEAMLGVELELEIQVEETILDFIAGFGVGVDEEGVDLNISGQVNDNLSIPLDKDVNLVISNLTVDATIKDDGTLRLGLGGKTSLDNHELDIAGDLSFNIPMRLPDGIAFKVSLDKLDYIAYYYANLLMSGYVPPGALENYCISQACSAYTAGDDSGMEQSMCETDYQAGHSRYPITSKQISDCIEKQKTENQKDMVWAKKWGKKEASILTFENGFLSFGTPGAEDPVLNTGAGVSMGVDLTLFKQHLGSPSLALDKDYIESLVKKIQSAGSKNPKVLMTAAPRAEQKTDIRTLEQPLKDFNLGLLSFRNNRLYQFPFRIKSETSLFGKGKNEVLLRFDNGGLYFDEHLKLDKFGTVELMFQYDREKDDYLVEGRLDAEFGSWLDQEVWDGINEILKVAKADYQKLFDGLKQVEADIKKTQDAFEAANKKIQVFIHDAPKVVNAQKELDHARSVLAGAEGRIDKICKNLPLKDTCKKANHYIFDDAQKAVDLASKTLDDAKKMVAIPKALTNAVSDVKKKLDTLLEDKRKKQSLMDVTKGAENFLNSELAALVSKHDKTIFKFESAVFAGDFRDIRQHGHPFVAEVKYTVNGQPKTSYLAFKPNDPAYTARAFALVPAVVLEEIMAKGTKGTSKMVSTWLLALVNQQIMEIQKSIQQEIGPDIIRYQKLLDTFATDGSGLMQARVDFMGHYGNAVSQYSMTDMMPPSKTFKNRYLAVGHSNLCLSVAPNGVDVYQADCKDINSEQWTTTDLGNGYVQLKSKGLCLKARTSGTSGSGEQPLILSQCDSADLHEQWKVISQDGFFDKIVNRFSQKCLHFDTENANPATAYAVWTSCLGADSQNFRDITDAERPTWHDVKDLVQAKNNRCLKTRKRFISYFEKTDNGHMDISSTSYNRMKQVHDDLLDSAACDAADADRFSYVEMINGDIKLVHAQTGWCVVPVHTGSHQLRLAPCNSNADMQWRPTARGGKLFELYNAQLKQCMTIESDSGTPGTGISRLSGCSGSDDQMIDFIE